MKGVGDIGLQLRSPSLHEGASSKALQAKTVVSQDSNDAKRPTGLQTKFGRIQGVLSKPHNVTHFERTESKKRSHGGRSIARAKALKSRIKVLAIHVVGNRGGVGMGKRLAKDDETRSRVGRRAPAGVIARG